MSGAPLDALEISERVAPARVVVAEDDHQFRAMRCQALQADGYEVVEARDGTELGQLVRSLLLRSNGGCTVELMIADVRMPGASGLSVLSELRRSDWNTPVILISAFADDELAVEAARLGAIVVDKPFDLQELMWFVRLNTGNV
jgi:DNA-binding response OmpR family regulator